MADVWIVQTGPVNADGLVPAALCCHQEPSAAQIKTWASQGVRVLQVSLEEAQRDGATCYNAIDRNGALVKVRLPEDPRTPVLALLAAAKTDSERLAAIGKAVELLLRRQ